LFTNTSALVDFEKELKKKFKLEAGLKHSYQVMSSDYYLKNMDYSTGAMVLDTAYSNVFNYKQNISAAYVNLTKDYKKISFQLGLRGENTIINTLSQRSAYDFNRQYFNIFPLISLDYKKSENHTFSISYNKRVNRPDYNSFNPFVVFLSTQTSYKGNPYLKPEYSHDFTFTHSYKSWLNNTVDFTCI
jgi:iron complex outermembrane receptor protein